VDRTVRRKIQGERTNRSMAASLFAAIARSIEPCTRPKRDHSEVSMTGKAKGAEHIPLMQLSYKADPNHPEFHNGLYQNKPIAVYCASGGRSGMAVNILNQLGYETTINIGGFGHWVQAGGPVDR